MLCNYHTHAHIHTHDCMCSFNLPLHWDDWQRGMGSDPWFHWRQSTAGCILSSPTTLFPPSILSSFPHSSSPPSTLVSPCPKCFLCPMIFDLWPWPSVWNSVCPPVVKPVWINEFRSQKLIPWEPSYPSVASKGFGRPAAKKTIWVTFSLLGFYPWSAQGYIWYLWGEKSENRLHCE